MQIKLNMNIWKSPILPVVAQVVLCCGCCFHKNLTETTEVQKSGVLGERFHTTQKLELIKDKHTGILRMVTKDHQFSERDKQIGEVEAGTELEVNQVMRVTELIAMLGILPEYWSWNCTQAKIESGSFIDKEVAVQGEELAALWRSDTAEIGSTLLVGVRSGNK